ncbi:hypothetical protein PsorP6_006978 [Peronosclerospora sorghi]|uniref:Uncharacterized protein n=1 Tax=Peronosclerospora sorghi TaxID=230839 RepID=A0ACC0WA59_9STRA|nr:hypothetical protein PsorP6_006978 [Peronosclerospora sorghi]
MAASCKVTKCLGEGSDECLLSSKKCPPCMYALTGGDYSCYSRDAAGSCPFPDVEAECDKPSSATTVPSLPASTTRSSPSTNNTTTSTSDASGATNNAPKAPLDTPKPAPNAPSPETAKPPPATPTTPATTTASEAAPSTPDTPPVALDAGTVTTSIPPTPSLGPSFRPNATASSSPSPAERTWTNKTTGTSSPATSPALVDLILVGGLLVLILILIFVVVRRMVAKKKLARTGQRTVTSSSQASQWSHRNLTADISRTHLYSTYSYKDEEGGGGGPILAASQGSSTYSGDYRDAKQGRGGTQPPLGDFSRYGHTPSHFVPPSTSPYYATYSVSTGPGVQGGSHGTASTQSTANFINVTATSGQHVVGPDMDSTRSGGHPLTVSQLMPTGFAGDDRASSSSSSSSSCVATTTTEPLQYGHVPPTVCDSGIAPTSSQGKTPPRFGVSTVSSTRSDYDIVDPITMHDVEARNTEMLAEASHYPKFSMESEVDLDDESFDSDEDDGRGAHAGREHKI